MRMLKLLLIPSVIVFMTCSPALSLIDVQQYLNPDVTIKQAAIEAAIAGGADPIPLAAELAAARCDLASAFAKAVATATPNIDIGVLTSSVIAAVAQACPEQVDEVTDAMLAAFPAAAGFGAGNSFQAANALSNTGQNQQNQTQNRIAPSVSQ